MFKERIYKIWKQFTTPFLCKSYLLLLCSKNEYTKSESNSQHPCRFVYSNVNCVQRTNIQNLKAIHNIIHCSSMLGEIVFKERIYKIWKQFTTDNEQFLSDCKLCSKNEYTKSESNSQRFWNSVASYGYCVQRTNIQNLKAIHNNPALMYARGVLCSKNEYTKSESNSQLAWRSEPLCLYCVQRTNIQNLKAIHNTFRTRIC